MDEKQRALEAKCLYNRGVISREEAIRMIEPYKQAFNKKSVELAAKYNVRPQRFSIAAFLR